MTDIRTFRAPSMQQALQLVRTHFGPHAAVLHTRQLSRGMLGWLVGRQQVEVTASNEFRVPSRLGPAPGDTAQTAETQTAETQTAVTQTAVTQTAVTDARAADPAAFSGPSGQGAERSLHHEEAPPADTSLHDQIQALRSVVERLVVQSTDAPRSDELQAVHDQLGQLDFPIRDVEQIVGELASSSGIETIATDVEMRLALREMLSQHVTVGGPIRIDESKPRVVVLVGPTGVGKTTTIAKLAANHHLRERHRVGLITVDTYRIAAVEQLRTYAEIIDLPMEVVSTPREMREAVAKMSDLDLILIDTAGRSPQDDIRLRELDAVVHEAEPDEVHLVLSVVAGATSLSRAVETFRQVGVTSLLLTKLDEAPTLGGIWPILKTGIPLSYTTNGQNVPDDIVPVDAIELCDEILGRSTAVVEN